VICLACFEFRRSRQVFKTRLPPFSPLYGRRSVHRNQLRHGIRYLPLAPVRATIAIHPTSRRAHCQTQYSHARCSHGNSPPSAISPPAARFGPHVCVGLWPTRSVSRAQRVPVPVPRYRWPSASRPSAAFGNFGVCRSLRPARLCRPLADTPRFPSAASPRSRPCSRSRPRPRSRPRSPVPVPPSPFPRPRSPVPVPVSPLNLGDEIDGCVDHEFEETNGFEEALG
jgi:hypothetical protein